MRLHLLLLALALGCATEDDTSSNDGDGDGGSVLSQVAEMATEMAEMSAKVAAQQATIAQLEMQMAETLRWETFEHTCVAQDSHESTGVTADGAVTATAYRVSWGDSHLEDSSPDFRDGEVWLHCYEAMVFAVTVGYER